MELQQIMDELRTLTPGRFPEEAVRAAIACREEITPQLLQALEQTTVAPDSLADPEFTLPLHALYLLAKFREPRAWPVILRLFGKPGEDGQDIADYTGDFIPEDLARVLACVYNDNLKPLLSVITNPACDDWVRGAGLRTLVRLVVDGRLPVAEVEKIFRKLLQGGLPREIGEGEEGEAWNSLASCCCDLRLASLQDELVRAFAEELINPEYLSIKELRDEMRQPLNLKEMRSEYEPPITDVAAEMRDWPCFTDPDWGKVDAEGTTDDVQPPGNDEVISPTQHAAPKVGRNDPCPCGSGKKHKKCCGE